MIELRWETEIRASAERVFALLAELRDYDRWLPRSLAFHGTTHISDGPITVGTTYIEPGPFATRHGIVTAFDRPTRLDFEQPMTTTLPALGTIGIRVCHTLSAGANSVHVQRVVQLTPTGPVRIVMPVILPFFRLEHSRVLETLKTVAESESGRGSA